MLAVIEGTWQAPAELVVLDAASGRGPGRGERWRTDLGASLREVCELPVGERFTVPHDGGDVHAWLVRPAGFEEGRSYPVLVNIHGGPFAQYTDAFFDEFAVQAGAGYAVVACNPRGSSGRGAAWGRAISASLRDDEDGDDKDGGDAAGGDAAGSPGWGDVDAADVLAVVDAALARWPWLDAARVGVLGGSYGGYLTSWLAARTDRFAAACSERAVNNLLTMTHTSDIGWWFNTGYMGVGQEDPMALLERSPVTYADDITAPMLLLHSEADLRCPIEQAEDLFTRLRRRHHDVELVRFPAESHGLSRGGAPRHRVQRFEIQLEFFARHLHPAGAAAGATPG